MDLCRGGEDKDKIEKGEDTLKSNTRGSTPGKPDECLFYVQTSEHRASALRVHGV